MSYKGNKKWPGMVTSVRDRKAEKEKKEELLKRKREEEEREKALRKSQEEVARWLEQKGKFPEDEPPPIREKQIRRRPSPEREKVRRRTREDSYEDRRYTKDRDSASPEPIRERRATPEPQDSRRSQQGAGDASRGARRRFEEALREERLAAQGLEGGYEGYLGDYAEEVPDANEGRWISSTSSGKDPAAAASASTAGASSGGWVVTEEATQEYEAQKKQAAQEKKKRMEEEKRRKAKLANAFAFGNEDDDDKREQERIAAAKQAAQQWKQEMANKVRPNKADVQGTRPRIDMYTALKMIADFKRSCNGKAKPMPPEIVEATVPWKHFKPGLGAGHCDGGPDAIACHLVAVLGKGVWGERSKIEVDGAELCGDEAWFADASLRADLRAAVREAHREQKILIASPAEEVRRICEGSHLGPLHVLRLGGAHLGGYGEADIAYSYRQLSRALHPDKNPDIPEADKAFHRLSEAAEELRLGLQEQRRLVVWFSSATGQEVRDDLMERPQEPLFAEACRLLTVVCGVAGEGRVATVARTRALAAFATRHPGCRAPELMAMWFERPQLLEALGSPSLRTAYDCAAKRYRAQFLCLLGRALAAEVRRMGTGMPRDGWNQISRTFPELGLWQEFREQLYQRCWDDPCGPLPGLHGRERSRSRERPRRSRWARKWRVAMAAILPSGEDMAAPPTDPEAQKLAHVIWQDVSSWVKDGSGAEAKRALGLFRIDHQSAATFGREARDPRPGGQVGEWCFIPTSDLFLVIGEDLVGVTLEGLFADNAPGQKRLSLAECYRKRPTPVEALNEGAEEKGPPKKARGPAAPTLADLLSLGR
ncbi:slc43a2 [Symbiodinium natans]|uniref:Slc43a2 protein n=1 Tax=Symbiodinium natans TaxID=878477 RepID=A0A812P293_9DINO|nr:slc43a2 [Symbiodinium natans]